MASRRMLVPTPKKANCGRVKDTLDRIQRDVFSKGAQSVHVKALARSAGLRRTARPRALGRRINEAGTTDWMFTGGVES
jgi:hypothetical protein